MAVRFSNNSDGYSSTTPASDSAWSATMWVQISTDRNTFTAFFGQFQATGRYSYLATASDGTTLKHFYTTGETTGVNMTAGGWYRLGLTVSGTSATLYYGTETGALTAAASVNDGSLVAIHTRIGHSAFGGEGLNGRIAALKQWSGATLTQGEIERELSQYTPSRTSNLHRWHPFLSPSTTDYSGNARTLTADTNAPTLEDGPPLPWSGPVFASRLVKPAASVSATASAENSAGTGTANDSLITVTDAPRPLFRQFAIPRAANF